MLPGSRKLTWFHLGPLETNTGMVSLFTMEDVESEPSSAQTRCGWNPGNFQRTLKSQA